MSFLEAGAEADREDGEWKVGPHVSAPIPVFDQGQARIAAAESQLRRRRQLYTATAIDIRSAARQRVVTAHRVGAFYHDEVLAAILFSSGVSFVGVMAFIFSGLVVFPVLHITSQYFGR